jgi:TolA-binding protein
MVGTSVLFIRGTPPRTPASASVTVTEEGSPAPVAVAPLVRARSDGPAVVSGAPDARLASAAGGPPPDHSRRDLASSTSSKPVQERAPAAASTSPVDDADHGPEDTRPFDDALRSFQARRFDDAAHAFDALAPHSTNAELWAARSIRESKGCRAAASRFDKVAQRAGQTPPGWDARLEGALCYRAMGDVGAAHARLTTLLGVDSHKDRARVELERLGSPQ